MRVLSSLNHPVFDYFERISEFPRGTGNEKQISDFLVSFAQSLNLEVIQDEHLNVLIKKPATKGYENHEVVMLQGHMDMVMEKNENKVHDFTNDPIKLITDDKYIYADGTTLGADNGIAVAYAMAILASKEISHPAIEVLITSGEEGGLEGASNFDAKNVSAKRLINLDSEEEGYITLSCAGGTRAKIECTLEKEVTLGSQVSISLTGLHGGHSGMDIGKGRENAIKLLSRVLHELKAYNFEYNLIKISGGDKLNAIPRESSAVISIFPNDRGLLERYIDKISSEIRKDLSIDDSSFEIKVRGAAEEDFQFDMVSTYEIVDFLNLLYNGVFRMSNDMNDMVLTSSNLGKISTDDKTITAEIMIRSNSGPMGEYYKSLIKNLCNKFSYKMNIINSYKEWEFKKESELRDICSRTYKELFNKEAKLISIHAGLECGVLSSKIEDLDIISIGPNMYNVHTPQEKLDIASSLRGYELLKKLLENL